MKDAWMLLEAIGEIQDRYVLEAHTQLPKKRIRPGTWILIAAAAALLLAGCAAAWHWYARYFTAKRQEPLSAGQVEYIQDHSRTEPLRQSVDGYTMELKSTISESKTAYATFRLTAPESVDLSSVLNPSTEERLSFRELLATPEGAKLPADLSYDVLDDGDGKSNTLNIVLKIMPMVSQGEESPFGPGKICTVRFRDLVKWGYDRDYEQELRTTKYAGQPDYLLTPEESARVHPSEVLVSGDWEFSLELPEADSSGRELLTAPVKAKALVLRADNPEAIPTETIEDVTITSIQLSPLSMTVQFEIPEPRNEFDCLYLPADAFGSPGSEDCGGVFLMLRDGTKIAFFQSEGAKETAYLTADSPIVLEEVAYLHLSGGVQVP